MKKLISHILTLILIILLSSQFFACKNVDREYYSEISSNDSLIITLFASNGKSEQKYGLFNFGHAFIGIENISDEDLTIYNYTIKPNEAITLGTWSIFHHFGIWFNVESNYMVNHNKYDDRLSISTGITKNEISILNEYLEDYDNWTLIKNCSYFAVNLWNTITEDYEKIDKTLIYNPTYITEQILKFDNFEKLRDISTSDIVGYMDDNKFIEYHLEGGKNA